MTKILVTIGPSSSNPNSIRNFAQYTKLFRLNGSHNTLDWHKETINTIRKFVPDAFILLDVPGAKPRTNNIEPIKIKKDQAVAFGDAENIGDTHAVKLTKPLPKFLSSNRSTFSVNDGQFLFDNLKVSDSYIIGRSRGEFTLLPKKGLNLPGSIYSEELQLAICTDFINKTIELDIDGFGLSFIQNSNILERLRDEVGDKILISKIENSEGLKNAQDIISHSDAVMIDRGDLAAEIGFESLFSAVETITRYTKQNGKPLIMATENLESMSDRDTPSKSEVVSLAHAISIGSDCIMLSEETAISSNGLFIVKWLKEFIDDAQIETRFFQAPDNIGKYDAIWKFVGEHASMPALLMTKSGRALFNYMKVRPNSDITLVSDNKKIIKLSQLFSTQIRVLKSDIGDSVPIETIWKIIKENVFELFKSNNQIVAIYVSKYVKNSRANCITVFNKNDFLDK